MNFIQNNLLTIVVIICVLVLILIQSMYRRMNQQSYLDGYTYATEALKAGASPRSLQAMCDSLYGSDHFIHGVRKALRNFANENGGEPS